MKKRIAIILICFLIFGIGIVILNKFDVLGIDLNSRTIQKIQDRALIEELRNTDITDLEKDNKFLSYDSETKELLITDDKEGVVLKMKLTSDYFVGGLMAGQDTMVAEFFLVDWRDGRGSLIDEINFFDVKDNYKETSKVFRYKYGVDFEECYEDGCFNHTRWIFFETLDELPHKNIKISAWTETKPNENIEWVPTINGFEVLQWAEWLTSTAVLVGQYDYSAVDGTMRSVAVRENKLYMSGTDIYEFNLTIAGNITIAAGVTYSTTFDSSTGVVSLVIIPNSSLLYWTGLDNKVYQRKMAIPGLIGLSTSVGSGYSIPGTAGEGLYMRGDGMHLYGFSSIEVFWDWTLGTGFLTDSITGAVSKDYGAGTNERGMTMKIDGSKSYSISAGNSNMKEFNYSINWDITSETLSYTWSLGYAPYNVFISDDGVNMYIIDSTNDLLKWYIMELTPDVEPPAVIIYSPENTTYNIPINFTVSSIDDRSMGDGECWVTVDGGTTNNSMLNTTQTSFYNYTAPNIYSNGGYLAEFYCNDSSGNLNDTENIAFTIETGAIPYLNIPTNDTRTVLEVDDFEFNMSLIEDWFNYTFIVWDGAGAIHRKRQVENGTGDADCSVASSGDAFVEIECIGQDIIVDGNYEWNVLGCGVSEICAYSLTGNYTFTLDATDPLLDIVSPTNNTNHTDNTLDIDFTRSDAIGLGSCWYSNDTFTVNKTLASCTNVTDITWTEGSHHVRVYVNDTVGNEVMDSVMFYIDSIAPEMNITSPINNTNHTNVNLDILFTRSDLNLESCWYSNDTYAANSTPDGTCNNLTAIVWGEDQHNVTIWANDTFGNLNETSVMFYIDSIAPEMNITSPVFVDYRKKYNNQTINFTSSDIHLKSCWGSFDGGTNNQTLTCGQNLSINITSVTNDSFIFWANDTFGNEATTSRTWIYRIFEEEQTFKETTLIGSTETFVNNIFLGSGETITEVNFNYNGTDRDAGYADLGGGEYNLSASFIIPSVASETNITFFWKINLVSTQVNTATKNQTIKVLSIDDCSVFSTILFNYTLFDEEDQSILSGINTTIEIDITIFDESRTETILSFSNEYNDTNPATICLNINLTEETIYALDSTVKYDATNYSVEYYNIQNLLIKNSTLPQTISLFDLLLEDATEFQVTFKDSNFVTVENALVQISRQYVSEGVFKTVEIPKTDSNGQTVVHLVEKDIVYNIIVLKDGEILGTFNNIIAFCEDVLIGSCFISLNALLKGEVAFDYNEDIGLFYKFNYNGSSRDLQFDFTTTDGSVKNVTLSAIKMDYLGNETVCEGFLISSSGTVSCPIPVSVGNDTIIVSIFVDGDLKITNYIESGRAFDIGVSGYFLMFFLVLSLALMMMESKTGVILGVIIGFISGVLLSFIQGGILAVGSSVIWLVVMGIILIYKLNTKGHT